MKRTRATVRKRSWVDHVMNETSVRNALLMFNVMFALQTGLDLAIVSGGAALPEGLSYASYAHRGAYPLVVTALLAGVFAILAQPYLNGPVMRALMIGWVAQNVALVASSMLRLDLYVDVYGLTHMRFAAFVWMGLVAVGLALMIWQLWRGLTARWLFEINGLALAVVLYGMCFVNISGIVARDQLARTDGFVWYVCELGEGALPAIYEAKRFEYLSECYGSYWGTLSRSVPSDWREWGFRNARIAAYLERNLKGAQG